MRRTPTVGGDIDSTCTRCRRVTNHTIVAMVQEKVVRVQCHTCGGTHNYRPPATSGPAPKATRPAAPRKERATRVEAGPSEEWIEATSGVEAAALTPYRMDAPFAVGALLRHPTFGVGLVRRKIHPNKIEVLFQDGARLLMAGA